MSLENQKPEIRYGIGQEKDECMTQPKSHSDSVGSRKDEAKVPTDEEILDSMLDNGELGEDKFENYVLLDLIAKGRLAGRREGAEEQREKDAKIVDLTPGVYGSRELNLVEHIAQAIRLQPTEEEGEK